MIQLHQLLKATVKQQASDLFLLAGSPPALRISGKIVRVKTGELSANDTERLCETLFTDEQRLELEEKKSITFSFGIKDLARFRVHIYYQRGTLAAIFRHIPMNVPELHDLGFPPVLKDLMLARKGLILISGPKGSGRTSTAAAMISEFNQFKRGHIVTIEKPIEYVHQNVSCLVSQQEVHSDVLSLEQLKNNLKNKSADLCFVGDIHSPESVEWALTLAESGCLVIATSIFTSSTEWLTNTLFSFPKDQRDRIESLLLSNLNAIICQQLLPALKGGLVAATEFLFPIPEIKKLISEKDFLAIHELMRINHQKTGMMTMNQSLLQLVLKRIVDIKEAFAVSSFPEELDRLLKNAGI